MILNNPSETSDKKIQELWKSYKLKGEISARNKLLEFYMPLVKIIAGRLAINLPSHVDRDDLYSSGFFGLLDAIERFDFNRSNKFETYASVRIRGAMLDYLRSHDWVSVSMRQRIRRYEKTLYELETKLGYPPKDNELADALQMSVLELRRFEGQVQSSVLMPLEDYLYGDMPDSEGADPCSQIEKKELKMMLASAIEELSEKEKQVVALYYYEELTLKEISLIMHLSEARISQLHSKAVKRMRGSLKQIHL